MATRSDTTGETLSRARLCALAGVKTSRHRRWLAPPSGDPLLTEKVGYNEHDLIRAAALDELVRVLKPATGRAVWRQIEGGFGLPGTYLEIVVRLSDRQATLVRRPEDLLAVLPRAEPFVIIPLHERIANARARLAAYQEVSDAPPLDSAQSPKRSSVTAVQPHRTE